MSQILSCRGSLFEIYITYLTLFVYSINVIIPFKSNHLLNQLIVLLGPQRQQQVSINLNSPLFQFVHPFVCLFQDSIDHLLRYSSQCIC